MSRPQTFSRRAPERFLDTAQAITMYAMSADQFEDFVRRHNLRAYSYRGRRTFDAAAVERAVELDAKAAKAEAA